MWQEIEKIWNYGIIHNLYIHKYWLNACKNWSEQSKCAAFGHCRYISHISHITTLLCHINALQRDLTTLHLHIIKLLLHLTPVAYNLAPLAYIHSPLESVDLWNLLSMTMLLWRLTCSSSIYPCSSNPVSSILKGLYYGFKIVLAAISNKRFGFHTETLYNFGDTWMRTSTR